MHFTSTTHKQHVISWCSIVYVVWLGSVQQVCVWKLVQSKRRDMADKKWCSLLYCLHTLFLVFSIPSSCVWRAAMWASFTANMSPLALWPACGDGRWLGFELQYHESSYLSSQTSRDRISLCTVSNWVCSEPHLCWSEARPLFLSAISESLTARSSSLDFDLALSLAISASLVVTMLLFSFYKNNYITIII